MPAALPMRMGEIRGGVDDSGSDDRGIRTLQNQGVPMDHDSIRVYVGHWNTPHHLLYSIAADELTPSDVVGYMATNDYFALDVQAQALLHPTFLRRPSERSSRIHRTSTTPSERCG